MNNLEKYIDQVIVQRAPEPEPVPATPIEEEWSEPNPIRSILRRWYIVLIVSLLVSIAGIPLIWLFIEPVYTVTGAIRVAPILENILTETSTAGQLSNYTNFMNTQAELIKSNRVIQRVADDLADRNLAFFTSYKKGLKDRLKDKLDGAETRLGPAQILKQAIIDEVITIAPVRHSELIAVSMKTKEPQEAITIVDSFIRNYMAVHITAAGEQESQKLDALESERKVLAEKLQSQRAAINELASVYGSKSLSERHDMKLKRVAALMAELTKLESQSIYLEAQVKAMEQTDRQVIPPQDLVQMQEEYISKDPTIMVLTQRIVELEQQLIEAQQNLAQDNPELERKRQVLEALKARLAEQKENAIKQFQDLLDRQIKAAGETELAVLRKRLEQTKEFEKELRDKLAQEDTETIGVGRQQLAIEELQDQMALTKEMYDRVERRIRELEMEKKRPARVSIAYTAEISDKRDKRFKFTAGVVFGAFALGCFLAYLRDKVDQSLPVTTRRSVPISAC